MSKNKDNQINLNEMPKHFMECPLLEKRYGPTFRIISNLTRQLLQVNKSYLFDIYMKMIIPHPSTILSVYDGDGAINDEKIVMLVQTSIEEFTFYDFLRLYKKENSAEIQQTF